MFLLYQTDIPIKHFNVLVALAVYNGALTDFDVVYQLVQNGPVKFLQVQIFLNEYRPIMNGGNFLFCRIYFGQKRLQAFRLGKTFLLILLHQQYKGIPADCTAILVLIKFSGQGFQLMHSAAKSADLLLNSRQPPFIKIGNLAFQLVHNRILVQRYRLGLRSDFF